MDANLISFLVIYIIAVTLLGALLFIVLAYFKLLKRYNSLEIEEEELKKKNLESLQKAQKDYVQIIQDARLKAQKLIRSAVKENNSSDLALDRALKDLEAKQEEIIQKASQDLLEKYKEKLSKTNEKNIQILTNISKDIEEYTENELTDYKKTIEEETTDSQKIVGEKIEEKYTKLEEELKDYKQKQLEKINAEIGSILKDVAMDVLGKSLDVNEQEELVTQALERAKNEHKI